MAFVLSYWLKDRGGDRDKEKGMNKLCENIVIRIDYMLFSITEKLTMVRYKNMQYRIPCLSNQNYKIVRAGKFLGSEKY